MENQQLSLDQDNIKHVVTEDPNSSPLKKRTLGEKKGSKATYTSQPADRPQRPPVYKDTIKAIEEYKIMGKGDEDFLVCRLDFEDTLLACGLTNGSAEVYSIADGKLVQSMNSGSQAVSPVTSLRWRPPLANATAKSILVTGTADGVVTHWHVPSGKLMDRFIEVDNQILAMDFNQEGTYFATGGKDYKVRVYDEATKENSSTLERGIWNVPGHSNRVFSLKFVEENGNILLSGGWDNNLHIWDLREKKSSGSIYGPSISGDAIDCKNGVILTGSWRNKDQLQLWDMGTRKLIQDIDWEFGTKKENAYVYSAQFSKQSDEYILAGTSNINEVRIYDKKSGYHDFGKIKLDKGCYSVDFANQKDLFAFCGGDGEAHLARIVDKRVEE